MRVARALSGSRSVPSALANFDSTTVFVRATANYLRGESFPRLGMLPRPLATVMPAANRLPRRTKQWLYRKSGASEGVPPGALGDVDIESFCRWVTDQYPERGYPAVIIGSSNGAAIHLAALLGVPWLPQTFLIPVRRSMDPGAGREDLEWGREPGRELLAANPDVGLHQMHDPNQDRLMVQELGYFRVKIRRLGPAYRRFLSKTLAPGGRIVLLECDSEWPTTRVNDRHVFQFGGLGGLDPEEYLHGSDRVVSFLRDQGGSNTEWNPPQPNGHAPEAEWGFAPALRDDAVGFADERDYLVRELTIADPRDLSPLVAALYHEQYAARGYDTDRLFIQDFTLLDPWWTLRTGSIPYWLPFNADAAADELASFLDSRTDPFEEIYLTLFSNGLDAAGQASIDRWRTLLERAETRDAFVGVDPDAYPLDFGTYVRYHSKLPETIRVRRPLLPRLCIDHFEEIVAKRASDLPVDWGID